MSEQLNILLADDDPDEAILFKEGLEYLQLPHEVIHVRCGDDLFTALQGRSDIDLVIVDVHMPGKNGLECLKEIKADPSLQHLPVIMMTISKNVLDIMDVYAHAAHHYVVKPYSHHNYIETLKKIFSVNWKSKPPISSKDDFIINLAFT